MLDYLQLYWPYLLFLLLVAGEITCFALTSQELFYFLFKTFILNLSRSRGKILIPIPEHLKGAILGGGLVESSQIKVVESLPFAPSPKTFFMTAKQARALPGTIYYVAKIHANTLELSLD